MSKILTKVQSGRLVQAVVYTAASASDPPKARAQKRKASTAARERLNARTSYQKLERCLADNFDNGDLLVTLTYADKYLPEDKSGAVRKLRTFFPKVRKVRKARGHPLHYIYVTEGGYPGGRLHHHFVTNATGDDLDELRRLWIYGDVDIERLTFSRGYTYEDLASYLTKEPRDWGHPHVGERNWVPSLGLIRSEPESVRVPDLLALTAPPEALVVSREGPIVNGWGEWCWIKYLLPYNPNSKRPKVKRKRHRRKKE